MGASLGGYCYAGPNLNPYATCAVHWTDSAPLAPAQYLDHPPMTKEDTMPVRLTKDQIETLHDFTNDTDGSQVQVEESREHRNVVIAQVRERADSTGRKVLLDLDGSYIDAY